MSPDYLDVPKHINCRCIIFPNYIYAINVATESIAETYIVDGALLHKKGEFVTAFNFNAFKEEHLN